MSCLEQREALEEENRQVHNTNHSTIARLQELETTGAQLQVIRSKTVLVVYVLLI